MDTTLKQKIQNMDYATMLSLWRKTPIGDTSPYFTGESGKFFKAQMFAKKASLSPSKRVQISKAVDW